jgi:metal transporter CNNM
VLVIIFAEIIPQTVCSRFGLQIGAAMVPFVRVIIYVFFVVAWPVAKLLEFLLGAHEGIVYRRAELKELVAMHATSAGHGDLQTDTVTIVGGKRRRCSALMREHIDTTLTRSELQLHSTCRPRSFATP